MEKQTLNKLATITSTLFDNFIGMYQVCDKDETDDYFKHFLILIFKDRKPHTIYGIKDKGLVEMLDDIHYLYKYANEVKGGEQE